MLAAIPDEQILMLIPACQQGDPGALEVVYDLYADRLYRYLVARTGDPEAAADLTTELFLRLIKNISRFRLNRQRPAASFSAWLYRIAANLAADHHRARCRRSEASLDEQLQLTAPEASAPHEMAERREAAVQLAKALEHLGEEQRLVLIGKFVEEMSNVEIAEWVGKSEGAVKSLQHRALGALARLLRKGEA